VVSDSFSKDLPEDKLLESINFLKEALRGLSEAFLFIDLKGTLQIANETACKFYSLSNEGLGRSFWDLFPDDYFGFSMRESLKFGISHRLIYKSQRFLELQISTWFILIGPPSCHGLVVLAKDIREKEKLQTLLRQGDQMKKLGEMSREIAHEIRNPLGGIRGFASLLFRDLEGMKHLQEMAAAILDGTKSLEKLVASILHYARPLAAQLMMKDLGALLKEFAKFIKVDPAFPSNVKLDLHIPNDSIFAPVDSDLLKSALLNLTFNAIQAMPAGGLLTLSLLKLEGCCQIAISDTGIGMDSGTLKSLFSLLFTTKKRGNGLGLVEAEKIIKAHRGTIDVRSQVGIGSTFTLTLPLRR